MTIKVGDKIPAATLVKASDAGPAPISTEALFGGRTVALFSVPGAFTPTCSAKHVPGYVEQADALRAAGVDEIWCVSVNDAFVMGAWGRDQKSTGKVRMMADGSADFAKATGLYNILFQGQPIGGLPPALVSIAGTTTITRCAGGMPSLSASRGSGLGRADSLIRRLTSATTASDAGSSISAAASAQPRGSSPGRPSSSATSASVPSASVAR